MNIIAREMSLPLSQITKDGRNSYILTVPTKNRAEEIVSPEPEALAPADSPVDERYDLVVIGGGPAGMAAAAAAWDRGVKNILIIERDKELGGILQQCIHNGFGLHIFKEELTGPEYAQRFMEEVRKRGISCKLDTMVLEISPDKRVTFINSRDGLRTIQAGAIILAMGCRERTRGAINIPGTRPAGIFSAGTAQRFVNMEGYMVGKKVVIFGSGDIGLIMARRMLLEGAEVVAVLERKSYSDGLTRNIVQCVQDFNIPLLMRHTIVDIKGKDRVEGIVIAQTDENKQPIKGTERELECDTILFSRGLIPENELSRGAGIELSSTGGRWSTNPWKPPSKGSLPAETWFMSTTWWTGLRKRAGRPAGAPPSTSREARRKKASPSGPSPAPPSITSSRTSLEPPTWRISWSSS